MGGLGFSLGSVSLLPYPSDLFPPKGTGLRAFHTRNLKGPPGRVGMASSLGRPGEGWEPRVSRRVGWSRGGQAQNPSEAREGDPCPYPVPRELCNEPRDAVPFQLYRLLALSAVGLRELAA